MTAGEQVFASIRLVLLGAVAVLQLGLSLPPLLAYEHGPGASVAFVVLALVPLVCAGWITRRRPLPRVVVAGGVVAVLGASVLATAALPADGHFGAAHWSFGLVGWHLLMLLADRVPALLAAFGAHLAAGIAQFVLAGPPDRVSIGAAGVVVLGVTSFQLGVLLLARVLLRTARQAAELAAEQERAATRAALAEQWAQDLRAGFAGGLGTTLPLLADLADGVLDPRAEDTRRRCAFAATQLRRLFAEHDEVPDPLVHEVAACVDVAERRGLSVSLAVSGSVVPVPTEVRRELTGPVASALSAARRRARVSLLRTDGEVRLAVIADAAPEAGPGPATGTGTDPEVDPKVDPGVDGVSGRVDVRSDTYGGQTRMEARWRTS
ncbi:hypothetical protein BN6_40350 [Saccharothrix espanaensis DSM 44229]|uniref:Signal transduction histidine kinase n=1 Tax=Saccharothrix espanaensis (strain ATCC 51144 / DSM 44229 / JCM 9112 / NBRC 15066 / NRRL 15764) TaxID=1179773 RepID=K0JYV4_SACES|nr:hypothetical protein BN6_40350 [Saccharothrix espanaensis DSM 44229]